MTILLYIFAGVVAFSVLGFVVMWLLWRNNRNI